MFVYLHGPNAARAASHVVHVCPGRHLKELGYNEIPSNWVGGDGTPIEMQLVFQHGRLEVDEQMGRYLVKNGIASDKRPSRIIRAGADEMPEA